MSKGDDLQFLRDLVSFGELAYEKVRGVSREQFDADSTLHYAVAHLIQIVGEAASRLSGATRADIPEVPWKEIIGMRHRLVHSYGRTDFAIVWTVATEQLPELITAVKGKLE
jgi:uncharacterized protein with HEPN domain